MKISVRLLLLFLMISVLPLGLFSYFNLRQDEITLRQEALGRMSLMADRKVSQIKTYLAERVQDVRMLAREPEVINGMQTLLPTKGVSPEKVEKLTHDYFKRYVSEAGLFYDVFLISAQGDVIFSQKHESDYATNLVTGTWRNTQLSKVFRNARMTLEPVISGYEVYKPSDEAAFFIAAPVMTEGKLVGVLAVQLGRELFTRVASDATGLGETGEVVFAQPDGNDALVTTPLKFHADAAMKFRMIRSISDSPMFAALSGLPGEGIGVDYRGETIVSAWRYIPELSWGMMVKVNADEEFATIYHQRKLMLAELFGLLLFSTLISYYFGRQISVPLQALLKTANDVAGGALDQRVNEAAPGELGLFARTFNRMTESLQGLYRTLEERIEERTRELRVSNEQLQEEIDEREFVEKALRDNQLELQTSKSQYDHLVTNIPVGVYLLYTSANGQFDFRYVSPRFCAMLGVVAEDVYDNANIPFGALHPDDLVDFVKLNQEVVRTQQPFFWEGRILVNGETRWISIESRPEPLGGGECLWDGVMTDVTERRLIQLELQHNEDLLNEAQHLGKLGSWELNLLTGKLRWSNEIYSMFELDPAVFEPSYEAFLNVIHPEDRDKVNQAYAQSLQDRQSYDVIHRLLFADGRIKWVREHCNSDFDEAGKPLRSVGAVQDITEQKKHEDHLRIASVAFETHEGILITDAKGSIIRVNRAFEEITGYSAEEVQGQNPRMLSSGRHEKEFYELMWQELLSVGTWTGEIWDRRKSGQIYPKWLTITAVKNDQHLTTEYVAIFSDITTRKQAEEEIRTLAFFDALTQLPNRRLLMDRLRLALSVSARSHRLGALLFMDMDKFKNLNDTLGHDYGDLLLIEVARRIQSCIREVDTVSRFGGDEFVVLIEDAGSEVIEASQKVALVAEKIRVGLTVPYQLKDYTYHSSPSIGVCLYRGNDESPDDLLKHADMAMYQAKESGRNAVRFFDPQMQQAVEMHAALEADLRCALPQGQLCLYYQIQVDHQLEARGAEALVRWIHPVRGMVSPATFIPLAEESSLILDIGHWVLETACKQLSAWSKNESTRNLSIAVNVSAPQFKARDFVELVADVLRKHDVDASRLKLELTESVVLNDVTDVVSKMHELKMLGVQLSLDDFGTGYSSLSYLKRLPLDQLKIDQSFVRDIISDPDDAIMVQTIIGMAKNFHLNVIAEGVETQGQLDFLKHNGCMAYQGYLFGRPVPIMELEAML